MKVINAALECTPMICSAKNGSVKIGGTSMDYVCGGSDEKKKQCREDVRRA